MEPVGRSVESCQAHPELMRFIGKIEGTVTAIKEDQTKVGKDVLVLFSKVDTLKDRVAKQYLIFSTITGVAGGAVGYFVKHFLAG